MEKERISEIRKKVSRVGLLLMIVGLIWYLVITVRGEGGFKPRPKAPSPWRHPQKAQVIGGLDQFRA